VSEGHDSLLQNSVAKLGDLFSPMLLNVLVPRNEKKGALGPKTGVFKNPFFWLQKVPKSSLFHVSGKGV
jgi:hypothetical protein